MNSRCPSTRRTTPWEKSTRSRGASPCAGRQSRSREETGSVSRAGAPRLRAAGLQQPHGLVLRFSTRSAYLFPQITTISMKSSTTRRPSVKMTFCATWLGTKSRMNAGFMVSWRRGQTSRILAFRLMKSSCSCGRPIVNGACGRHLESPFSLLPTPEAASAPAAGGSWLGA